MLVVRSYCNRFNISRSVQPAIQNASVRTNIAMSITCGECKAESLKLTEERFISDWEKVYVPEIKSGKKLLIAAHGNTLRALVKRLDNISAEDITELNIPTGVPLVYELDENMKPIPHKNAIAPLSGRYLGNQEEVRQRIGAVLAQTK
jgi:2,3-bisphosphoglycerate-dependent phosphoglycerate mutase